MFRKKTVLKTFTKFPGKQLCRSLFFNEVASWKLKACSFIKNDAPGQAFSYDFCDTFKNAYFETFQTTTSRSALSDQRELFSPFWNFSVLLISDHGKCLVREFGSRIYGKIAWKINAWKPLAEQLFSEHAYCVLLQKQQVWIYWGELFLKLTLHSLYRFIH